MFKLSDWTRVQSQLLADPAYAGMMPGSSADRITVVWRADGLPGPAAQAAMALIDSLGITAEQATKSPTETEIAAEQQRLIEIKSDWLEVLVVGPDARSSRIDVTVAVGSFAAAEARGIDVLTELNPRLPIALGEGERPVIPLLKAPR